jgi:hypothetical protein
MRLTRTAILSAVWISALMSFNHPADAIDNAKPKIAEAKLLAEGAERIFREVDRRIARRHELVFKGLSPERLSCNSDGLYRATSDCGGLEKEQQEEGD